MDLSLVASKLLPETSVRLERSALRFERVDKLSAARGDFTLVSGAEVTPDLFEALWSRRADAEAVVASRDVRGARAGPLASRWTNRLSRRLLHLPCFDVTSSAHLYRTSALRRCLAEEPASSTEILVRLVNAGFKLKEVPWDGAFARESLASHLAALPRLWRLRRDPGAADAEDWSHHRHRRRMDERQAAIVSFLEVDVPVLDVGCGSTRLVQTLSKGVGLDRNAAKIRFLRGRAKAAVCGDMERLPFRDGSFPQLVVADLPVAGKDVAELKRVLTPRGTLVLATPTAFPAEIEERLSKEGFTVDETRRVGSERIVRAVLR